MIQLSSEIKLDEDAENELAEYQGIIDALGTFDEKSARAKVMFSSRNKIGNKTFDHIKTKLTEICSGARRCVYCEDSVGDEVEHIRPKDLYPENCFQWSNYVYACGTCNGPKNNKFAVFRDSDGEFVKVNPPKGQKACKPPQGQIAIINPRVENPLEYCMLDLSGTFNFVIIAENGTKEYVKADYTINEVLRLNGQREYLRQARHSAFDNYKSRLYYYNQSKIDSEPKSKLDRMINSLKKEGHPTVWKEMQRQYQSGLLSKFDTELELLFDNSPEALNW